MINFDLPSNIDDYVHRIGRTGRVGNIGNSVSLMNDKNRNLAKELAELLHENEQELPDWLETMAFSFRGGGGGRGRGGGRGQKFGARDVRRENGRGGGGSSGGRGGRGGVSGASATSVGGRGQQPPMPVINRAGNRPAEAWGGNTNDNSAW